MTLPILVAGLGNIWMRDDGIGVRVVRELAGCYKTEGQVEFLEAGMSGMRVLHALAGRRAAVLVDCACLDQPAGAWRWFEPDEVVSRQSLRGLVHEGDVLAVLELSRSLGECPDQIQILGIQPAVVEPGEGISPGLEARLPEYVECLAAQLRAWLGHAR